MKKKRTSPLLSYFITTLLIIGSFSLMYPNKTVLSNTDGIITSDEETVIPEENMLPQVPDNPEGDATISEEPLNIDEAADTETSTPPSEEPILITESESTIPLTDTQRPVVTLIQILPPSTVDQNPWPAEDMTKVPLDSKIQITIEDNSTSLMKPGLDITSSSGEIIVTDLESTINEPGKFILTFTLIALKPSETYNVYLSPYMTDSDGNRMIPKYFKFSTMGEATSSDTTQDGGKSNPHGSYMSNTNTCANCHSTHVAKQNKLEGGKYPSENLDAQNYCMACHDGTLGINIPDNWNKAHTHFDYDSDVSTCTSCHNPHLNWSTENPNLLKDYYVHNHTSINSADVGLQDSRVLLCEACHDTSTNIVKTDATYRISHYQKMLRPVTPEKDPLALCFSCHNGQKESSNPKYVNIEKYYSGTDSGHYITNPEGISDGQIPCSDCHETHGSNNLSQLKDNLGNEKVLETEKYKTTGTEWNETDEKAFCLKCHNSSTNLYEKTLNYRTTDEFGQPLPWHNTNETCSNCHGTGTGQEKYRSSAHSPIKKPTYIAPESPTP